MKTNGEPKLSPLPRHVLRRCPRSKGSGLFVLFIQVPPIAGRYSVGTMVDIALSSEGVSRLNRHRGRRERNESTD